MKKNASLLLSAVFVLCAVLVQSVMTVIGKEYCLTQLTMSLYYSIVVIGLSLVMGYAGQVSLGHAAFFALGGYTTAILTTCNLRAFEQSWWAALLRQARILVTKTDLYGAPQLAVTPWAAFLAAIAGAGAVACLIGYPALRLKGHYLAMATLGFGLIVYRMLIGTAWTGASDGINGVPEWTLMGGLKVSGKSALRVQNYYIACSLTLLILLILRNLTHSRVGRALLAIHDRETAANALGVNTSRYKMKVFIMSAILAAIAGVFFTHYTAGIGPSEAGALKSVRYLALVVAGGMNNLWGCLGISTLINYLSLRGWFGSYDQAVFGGLLVAIISLAPDGPLRPLAGWLRNRFKKKGQGTD